MKKNTYPQYPNLNVWCVKDWVMTEHHPKYTIFVPVRDGDDPATITQSHSAQSTTEDQQASTGLEPRGL